MQRNAGVVDCMDGTDEHECDNTHEGSSTRSALIDRLFDNSRNCSRSLFEETMSNFDLPKISQPVFLFSYCLISAMQRKLISMQKWPVR